MANPTPNFIDHHGFKILDMEPLGEAGDVLSENFTLAGDHVATTDGAHGATATNTPSTIVQRDASGDVAVGKLTATGATIDRWAITPDGQLTANGGGDVNLGATGTVTAGALIGTTTIHVQAVPAATWVINHRLNRFPGVVTVDSAGREVMGDVSYADQNTVMVKFTSTFSGSAYLN